MKKRRKLFTFMMMVCLGIVLVGCTQDESREEKQENATTSTTQENETTDEKALVVYFSATGTTKNIAENIARVIDADIYEIVPAEPYTSDDLNYNDPNSRATLEMNDETVRPTIGSDALVLDTYTTVYLGYPIWWGNAPRILSTFVEKYDFDGIRVIPFCTSGGSGINDSGVELSRQARSGSWVAGRDFDNNVTDVEILEWINEMHE